jgi:hypothetical protein
MLFHKGRATPNPSQSVVSVGLSQGKWPVHIAERQGCAYGGPVDVSVEINCEICGSANYSLPAGETDDGLVLCNDCGAAQGSLGELKAALLERAVAQSAEALRQQAEALRGTISHV